MYSRLSWKKTQLDSVNEFRRILRYYLDKIRLKLTEVNFIEEIENIKQNIKVRVNDSHQNFKAKFMIKENQVPQSDQKPYLR